jgi:hypothetical protein
VLEKQERALTRRKEQIKDHKKKNGRTLRREDVPILVPSAKAAKQDGIEVVRSRPKQRTLTVDQAVRALLKSKAPVLVFSEPEGGGVRVAYRLEDGQVGLLELD